VARVSGQALNPDLDLHGGTIRSNGGGFESLPPITFPLTSGVRSMLRQISAGKSRAVAPSEAIPGADAAVDWNGDVYQGSTHPPGAQHQGFAVAVANKVEARGVAAEPAFTLNAAGIRASFSFGKPAVADTRTALEAGHENDAVGVVRAMLGSRKPQLLATLDATLLDNEFPVT
jgi:hypothetical protein